MSVKVTQLPGFRIEKTQVTGKRVTFTLNFTRTRERSVLSPLYIANGVVLYQFLVQQKDDDHFSLLVNFDKERKKDKLAYTITYTQSEPVFGTCKKKKDVTVDGTWRNMCDTGVYDKPLSISIEVNITSIKHPYSNLHEDSTLTDLKLLGIDGFVLVHKIVAASHSPFLKKIVQDEWKPATEGVVEIPNTSQATLQHFKDYMYLGTLPESGIKPLLLLSMVYMMRELEDRCLFVLRSEVTKHNLKEMVHFAIKHDVPRLIFNILGLEHSGEIDICEIKDLYD